MEKTKLYIIQGFLGAGKTTFSNKLAKEKNALVFNPDEWVVKLYKKSDYENNWNKCFNETVNTLWKMASIELKSGKNVIFDMGFWIKSDREKVKKFAIENNADLIHYYVYAPDEILIERLKTRKGSIASNNLKNFDSLKSKFMEPSPDEEAIIIHNY